MMLDSVAEFLPGVLLTYSAFLLLLLSPGPNIMAVIGTSISISRSSGVALGLGIAGGTLFWSCLTVLGVTSFITAYAVQIYPACMLKPEPGDSARGLQKFPEIFYPWFFTKCV